MTGSSAWLPVWLIGFNLLAFVLFGVDKRRAQTGKWRIRESTLLLAALLGGSLGSLLGMLLFRHKIRHRVFTVGLPVILVCQLIVTAWLLLRGNGVPLP